MKNKILRLSGSHKSEMEFFCVDTNEVNPDRELSITPIEWKPIS